MTNNITLVYMGINIVTSIVTRSIFKPPSIAL